MSKTLAEMAGEILAARVRHEAMTPKQIESFLDDTFEALQKLKEKEDIFLGNAIQDPIKEPEKPVQTKAEPGENAVEEPTDKPEQTPLKSEPDESPVETPTEEPEQQGFTVEEPIEESEEPSKPAVQLKKATISGTILDIIKSKPRGVDTTYIMEQTGFNKNQVWATVNSAKKKGQIKTKKRGIYVSVKSRKVK